MIGKFLSKTRQAGAEAIFKVASNKTYDITDATKARAPPSIPEAPRNPYKKRPVKLRYDKNEYWSFRLPSEHHFLLSPFDKEDIFGKRKGIEHSPHIRAQLELDNNILLAWAILMLVALYCELPYHDEFTALRENMDKNDYGKFTIDDFK